MRGKFLVKRKKGNRIIGKNKQYSTNTKERVGRQSGSAQTENRQGQRKEMKSTITIHEQRRCVCKKNE